MRATTQSFTLGVNLRSRASRLDVQCRSLKAKLREYEQQQTLVIILRDELRRIQHFVAEAWSDGTLITSAPMKRYLGPFQSEYVYVSSIHSLAMLTCLRYPADLSFLKTTAFEREKVAKLTDELATVHGQYSQALAQLDSMGTQAEIMRAQLGIHCFLLLQVATPYSA